MTAVLWLSTETAEATTSTVWVTAPSSRATLIVLVLLIPTSTFCTVVPLKPSLDTFTS